MHLHTLQHPHNHVRPLYLNHKLVLYPISGVLLPLQGLITSLNPLSPLTERLSLPTPNLFPKPAPCFANIPVILLLFYAHKVKIILLLLLLFSFSPPLFTPTFLPKACGVASPSHPPLHRLGPSCWPAEKELEVEGGEMTGAAPPPAS